MLLFRRRCNAQLDAIERAVQDIEIGIGALNRKMDAILKALGPLETLSVRFGTPTPIVGSAKTEKEK